MWGGDMRKLLLVALGALVLLVAALAAVVAAPDSSAQSTGEPAPALEDFEPSEELPADSAISFPVDI